MPVRKAWKSDCGRKAICTPKTASRPSCSATSSKKCATPGCVCSKPTWPGWAGATPSASTAWPTWARSCPNMATTRVPSSSRSTDGRALNATPASGAATKLAVTGNTFASTSLLSSAPAFQGNPTSLPTSTVFSVGKTFPSMCVSSNGRPSPRWSSIWTDGARTPNIRRPSVAKARRSIAGISS